jgi:glutamate racemase
MTTASDERPLGIFDSGIGGLTVLKEIARQLPAENLLYLGDTARVPYGIRSPETVMAYAFQCTEFLLQRDIKLLVIACNTVSATSLGEIQEKISVPSIGVIEPGARAAVRSTRNKRVGGIGTEATIKSNAYTKAIRAIDEGVVVFGLPCPLFVPLVEEGWTEGTVARLTAERYLNDIRDLGVDTLVLGCTHYPLLKGVIREVMGDVALIDSAVETAKAVSIVLDELNLRNRSGSLSRRQYFVTDSPQKFAEVGSRVLQAPLDEIERVRL